MENNSPSEENKTLIQRLNKLPLGLVFIAGTAIFLWFDLHPAKTTLPSNGEIAQKIAELTGPTHGVKTLYAQGLEVQVAIRRADFATADKIFGDTLSRSQLQDWIYVPFNELLNDLDIVNDAAYEENLNQWVAKENTNPIPYLVRSQYYLETGKNIRGSNFASTINEAHMNSFAEYLQKAANDADSAIKLNDKLPISYYQKLYVMQMSGNTPETEAAFETGIAHFPNYYPLYRMRLSTLEPKWGGTVEAMIAFVKQYVEPTAEHSPLRLLYIDLYSNIIDAAIVECYSPGQPKTKECVSGKVDSAVTPSIENGIKSALALYNTSDKHQYDKALDKSLCCIIQRGVESRNAELLQDAADVMKSDNQLDDKNHGHNNYVLDKVLSRVWSNNSDNAEKKLQEAVLDLKSDPYPDEGENATELASLYRALAGIYYGKSDFANVIAYSKAADILMGSEDRSYRVCQSYFVLKRYDDAVAECKEVLKNTNDHDDNAHLWLAKTYYAMGKPDDALHEYGILADSESRLRAFSAIAMTVIYGERNENQKSLDVLNKYPYLYDINQWGAYNIAVSYNNRCYAYMELGEYQKALDDCNMSLKYGDIPDALQKKQELLKKLPPAAAK